MTMNKVCKKGTMATAFICAVMGTLVGSVIPTEREVIVNRTTVKTVEKTPVNKLATLEDFTNAFHGCMNRMAGGSDFNQGVTICRAYAKEAVSYGRE